MKNHRAPPSPPPAAPEQDRETAQDWQERLLRLSQLTASVSLIVGTTIAVVWTPVEPFLREVLAAYAAGGMNLFFLVTKKGSRGFQTAFLLGSTGLMLMVTTLSVAWAPAMVALSVLLVVLTGLLAARWVVYLVIASVVFTYLGGGLLVAAGSITIDESSQQPAVLAHWLRVGMMVLMAGGVLVYLLRSAMSAFSSAHTSTRAALLEAKSELRHAERLRAERIEAESKLRSTYKQQAVGQLASGLAHHFNNLLTVVRGLIEDIRQASSLGQVRTCTEKIREMVLRGAEVLRKLMLFGRPRGSTAAVLDVGPEVLAFEDGLHKAVRDNIRLSFSLEDECFAEIDPTALRQLLLGFVLNATDALPDGGDVAIEVRRAELAGTPASALGTVSPGAYVQVSVRDSGVGMSDEVLGRAADPFFTTKGLERHAGLGLPTALGIARSARGTVCLESQPGTGTTATAYLRLAASSEGAAAPAVPGTADASSIPTAPAVPGTADASSIPAAEVAALAPDLASTYRLRAQPSAPGAPLAASGAFPPEPPVTGGAPDAMIAATPDVPSARPEPQVADLEEWKARFVPRLLRAGSVMVGVATVIGAIFFGDHSTLVGVMPVLAAAALLGAVGGWSRRIALSTQVGLLLATFVAVALPLTVTLSFRAAGTLACTMILLGLSAVLATRRTTLVVLGLTAASFVVGGLLHSRGVIPTNPDFAASVPGNWYRIGMMLGLALALLAVSVLGVVDHVRESLLGMRSAIAHLVDVQRVRDEEGRHKLRLERMAGTISRVEAAGRLAGTVAHDLNNVMHAMMMAVSEVDLMEILDREEIAELVDDLERATEYGAALVAQFDLSDQASPLDADVIDLSKVVNRAVSLIEHRIGSRITLELSLEAGCHVRLSERDVNRVVSNLVQNSQHALPQGGRIELRVAKGEDGTVALTIEDDGHGMDEETQAHAFEPFFTTKDEAQGTGLGLAAVASVVGRSGGTIDVGSEPGVGTRIVMRWPLQAPPPPQPSRRRVSQKDHQGLILVADDDDLVRATFLRALGRAGFEVIEAADGDQARALIEARSDVDLYCFDGIMPGYSTRKLIEDCLSRHPQCPIILCSGYLPDDLDPALLRDEVTFLQKPVWGKNLVRAVSERMERSRHHL